MARRKTPAKRSLKPKLPKLDKVFPCPFCDHVDVTFSKEKTKKDGTYGKVMCGTCFRSYTILLTNNLDAAIDVYFEWCNKVEEKAKEMSLEHKSQPHFSNVKPNFWGQ